MHGLHPRTPVKSGALARKIGAPASKTGAPASKTGAPLHLGKNGRVKVKFCHLHPPSPHPTIQQTGHRILTRHHFKLSLVPLSVSGSFLKVTLKSTSTPNRRLSPCPVPRAGYLCSSSPPFLYVRPFEGLSTPAVAREGPVIWLGVTLICGMRLCPPGQ